MPGSAAPGEVCLRIDAAAIAGNLVIFGTLLNTKAIAAYEVTFTRNLACPTMFFGFLKIYALLTAERLIFRASAAANAIDADISTGAGMATFTTVLDILIQIEAAVTTKALASRTCLLAHAFRAVHAVFSFADYSAFAAVIVVAHEIRATALACSQSATVRDAAACLAHELHTAFLTARCVALNLALAAVIGIFLKVIAAIFTSRLPFRTVELARAIFADLPRKTSRTAVAAVRRVRLNIRADRSTDFVRRFTCRRLRINRIRINRIGIRLCLALTALSVAILILARTIRRRTDRRLLFVLVFFLGRIAVAASA